MEEREKGVQTAPCPNCGSELKAVNRRDGAVGYENCNKCYKQPLKKDEKVAAREAATLHDIHARQVGTDVTEENDG